MLIDKAKSNLEELFYSISNYLGNAFVNDITTRERPKVNHGWVRNFRDYCYSCSIYLLEKLN
jgi:hypothetical protein